MTSMPRRVLSSLILPLALALPVRAGVSETSYQEARRVLDKGLQAMGGVAALQAVRDVTRVGRGTGYNQGQSLGPDLPLSTRSVEQWTTIDFAGKRVASEVMNVPTNAVTTRVRTVLTGDTGFGHNLVTKVITPSTPAGVTNLKTAMRRDPAALLLTAHGRSETLRSLGDETIDGKRHQVITFADSDGTQIGLAFDAESGLLARIDTLADNAVLGDTRTETLLSDYREVPAGAAKVRLPAHVVTRVAGDVTLDMTYSDLKANAGPAEAPFAQPTDAVQVPPVAPGGPVTMTKLGEDVYYAGGSTHQSLVVGFRDHVVVVDAPLGEDRSQAVLAKIAETLPGKPVRYVVPSHYHFDHSGGLRTYIAQGVTVITTPGNKAFVDRLAKAPHTIRPDSLARAPRAAVVETFQGKRVLTDGTRTLELHDIGPNPHVNEAVVAYLPAEKVLFVADLLTIPVNGPYPPPSPALKDFTGKIQTLGLTVETFAPAHGRLGKKEDLQAALAAPSPKD